MSDQKCIRVAVDAMGGDEAPGMVVEALSLVDWDYPVHVMLVGPPEVVDPAAAPYERVTAVHAASVVEMKESASDALKKKQDSGMAVAVGLTKKGLADAFVSAGNTGAAMAFSLFGMGRIPGVSRPAILTVLPTATDTPAAMLDIGANVDCKPELLVEFAIMGSVYMQETQGIENPRVALLNIGSESSKGNEQAQSAYQLLTQAPINFIGNAEGRAFMRGDADVFVCDGFVGNILLKFGEGFSEWFFRSLYEHINSASQGDGGERLRSMFLELCRDFDYSEYGGAVMLGVQGTTIICHGGSSPKAFAKAIRVACESHERDTPGMIAKAFAKLKQE